MSAQRKKFPAETMSRKRIATTQINLKSFRFLKTKREQDREINPIFRSAVRGQSRTSVGAAQICFVGSPLVDVQCRRSGSLTDRCAAACFDVRFRPADRYLDRVGFKGVVYSSLNSRLKAWRTVT